MRRRSFLTTGALTMAGLAGCTSSDSEPATENPNTDDPQTSEPEDDSTTREPANDSDIAVSLDAVQPGVVELISPDSLGVHETNDQYVYLQVDADDPPARDEFTLQFDGESYTPTDLDDFRLYRERADSLYSADSGSGWVLFEVPSGDGSDAAVTWPGGEWQLPDRAREQLSNPTPELSVDVESPDPLSVEEEPSLTVSVTNEGSTPGQFVAGVNRQGPMVAHIPVARLSMPVPAGETATRTITDSFLDDPPESNLGDGEPDATYDVEWAGGSVEQGVRVVEQ